VEVKTFWWNKSRRAQSSTDFETCVEGEVVPTIIVMRNREGKSGGGKGPMLGDKSFTLATSNDQVLFEPIIFYANRVADIRLQDDKINTLQSRMGTGGNNMPMVAHIKQETMIDTGNQIVYAIDSEGSNSMKSKNPNSGSNEVTIANTITTMIPDPSDYRGGNAIVSKHAVAYDEFNDTTNDTHHTLRSGTKQSTGVVSNKQVRRLTPLECERLQGFPDDWTVSQSDSARYKQMGNAVAVPVVDWLIKGFTN
jgi:site-specific DNA-cytosine methylase